MRRLKQFFHKLSIRKKMLTILCLVGMVPVLVLGISLGFNSYRTVLKYREKDMTNTLQQACGIVDYQMYTCQQMMNYFVYNQDVINFLECDTTKKTQRYELYQEVLNTIGALKYQNLIMESVTIYSEGIQQSFGNETHPLEDLYKESWYRDGIRDKEWVFDENTLDLISIYKIPSYSGIESYVAVRTDIPTLFESLNQLAVDQYGVHVQTQNDEIWNFSGKKCTDKNGIYVSFTENKKDYLWVQQDLNQMDATVIYFQKKSNISPFSGKAFLMIAVQVGACLICIILLGRRFAKYLSRPLEELTEEIQSMDEMNIQATVHSNREDEMGILINSYNHMMQRIQELIRENYETQIARKEFEMKALQAQINPHFLYNSLSMINWKAIEAGEEEISQVTLALSAFYRTTLNKGKTWISLRLALQNIQAYVQLQLWMHDNDFEVHYEVDEKLLDYELPSLIFQPFVENALEHGLDIKEDPDHQIWFRIWEDPQTDLIYVSIRDNGVGMDADRLAHVLEYHATGYGVKNVNDRMKLSFGEDYTIQIKSEQGKGTEVLLHFPKVQKGESNES